MKDYTTGTQAKNGKEDSLDFDENDFDESKIVVRERRGGRRVGGDPTQPQRMQ